MARPINAVGDTSPTTGTGALAVAGVVPSGFLGRTIAGAGVVAGGTLLLSVENPGHPNEWEVGLYTFDGANLARTALEDSGNGGAPVNFSAGTKVIYATITAGRAVCSDAAVRTPSNLTAWAANGLLTDSGVPISSLVSLSAFNPNDALPVAWVRADDIAGGDGTAVVSFVSIDANARTFTGSATLKTGVNGINGHKVLRFVPGSSNKFTTPAGGASLSGQFRVGIVLRINTLAGFQHLMSWGDAAGAGQRRGLLKWGSGSPSADNELTFNTHGNDTDSRFTMTAGAVVIVEAANIDVGGTNQLIIYVNGRAWGYSTGTLSAYTAAALFLGCNPSSAEFLDADVAEAIWFGSTDVELSGAWRQYAAERYGVNLFGSHTPQPFTVFAPGGSSLIPANLADTGDTILTVVPFQNTIGETLFMNEEVVAGGQTSNVLALYHAKPTGSAAIRCLEYTTHGESGAMGYQNGGGGFYLDGYMFIAGTQRYPFLGGPYTPGAPAGVCMGQEGVYLGAEKFVRRVDIAPDWSIKIRDPNGGVQAQFDPDGNLGFYGHPTVAQQLLATGAGHTVDDVIAALQSLGLVRQS